MAVYKIVTSLYAFTYKSIDEHGSGIDKNNTILMGSFVRLTGEEADGWVEVIAFSIQGWIKKEDIGDEPGLKVFFVDVGQGDGALIEVGNEFKMLIDGGPGDNLANYLQRWQYSYYFNKGEKVHFDYVFISHFDKDHYQGLIDIINDGHYTFGTIFHNGIAKFSKTKENFPEEYDCNLGSTETFDNTPYLKTSFSSIEELVALKDKGGMQDLLEKFTFAVSNAFQQNRIKDFQRADYLTPSISRRIAGKSLSLEILGPVTDHSTKDVLYKYFSDDSHTVNGHSIVLKLTFGNRNMLFGGDLNTASEEHLMAYYGDVNPFESDVVKSCHHGASEFTTDFMGKINPYATVISSGDNEAYSHPRADAIGCAGKYSRSRRPLVFSTELARSTNLKTEEIKYGMINLRCNGEDMIMAQMKEAASSGSVWDLYDQFI
ncbi:hypothetical protein FEM33_13350 [Dyadobacter flavalbus]|uniref:MBL fold metallo-hydrolase n=1 Tax=Dyadobacter flavalbus TaxID=2579942 RepID=A0A5M8QX53_9BACT|nr:hypothetical protein [Dyadobacter flavalbus]KAA6439256.1 hypothetical protein FEM33_13350 [Dyadobacter flavalbus]